MARAYIDTFSLPDTLHESDVIAILLMLQDIGRAEIRGHVVRCVCWSRSKPGKIEATLHAVHSILNSFGVEWKPEPTRIFETDLTLDQIAKEQLT